MAYLRTLLVGVLGAASLVGVATVGVSAHEGNTLVEFDSMTPVTGAAVGAVNDRGITGGGLPWAITSGKGTVSREGRVSVKVRGLIIPVLTPPHNPLPTFSATVSCLTEKGVVNVTTGPFPTGSTGEANINARVKLPHRCKDPEVFVGFTQPSGVFVWFAESNQDEED